jgi:hypothetical protein
MKERTGKAGREERAAGGRQVHRPILAAMPVPRSCFRFSLLPQNPTEKYLRVELWRMYGSIVPTMPAFGIRQGIFCCSVTCSINNIYQHSHSVPLNAVELMHCASRCTCICRYISSRIAIINTNRALGRLAHAADPAECSSMQLASPIIPKDHAILGLSLESLSPISHPAARLVVPRQTWICSRHDFDPSITASHSPDQLHSYFPAFWLVVCPNYPFWFDVQSMSSPYTNACPTLSLVCFCLFSQE